MSNRISTLNSRLLYALLTAVTTLSLFNAQAQGGRRLSDAQLNKVMAADKPSIEFIENKGQWPQQVLFRADVPGAQMVAMPEGMLVAIYDMSTVGASAAYETQVEEIAHGLKPGMSVADLGPAPVIKGHAYKFNFIGGNLANGNTVERKGESFDYYNYLSPGGGVNATNVHSFSQITYKEVYAGVDVKYYTAFDGSLENDIIVHPGANAGAMAIKMEGIDKLRLNANGDIVMPTSIGEMTVPHPVSYTIDENGKKEDISVTYHLTGNNTLTFDIPKYDHKKTLVIDPIVMRWATMVSNHATADSHCHGIDLDASGNIYVTGKYQGGLTTTVGAFQTSSNGSYDLFVGKYQEPNTPGNAGTRVWQTYVGGSSSDNPYALDIGPDGYLYVTGITSSNLATTYGSGFSAGSWTQRTRIGNNGSQAFIMKMDPNGNGALFREIGTATNDKDPEFYDLRILPISGNRFDLIAVGYVTQSDGNADGDVPAPINPDGTSTSNSTSRVNGYVLRINNTLDTIRWAKQYGSNGSSNQFFISVIDSAGNVVVGGNTNGSNGISASNPSGQTGLTGNRDGWLASLNASNGNVRWSRYFNGGSSKTVNILCMETNRLKNQFVIGGITSGLATVNITSGTASTTYNGGSHDLFVASLPASGAATTWGTYYGGNDDESNMMGLNLDQNDDVYVLGYSDSKNISTAGNPIQTNTYDNNNSDAIFFKLTGSDGATVQYSTYLGGTSDDYDPIGERGIRFNQCRIYLAITTNSTNFPLTRGTLAGVKYQGSGANSRTSNGEPVIVSMANPPDLSGNSILSGGNQTITCGQTPAAITSGTPAYIIPDIIRDSVVQTNGTSGAYPSGLPTIASYQWQKSTDSGVTWTNINGATGLNYSPGNLTTVGSTWFRRIINNDACNRASDTLAVVKIIITPLLPAPTPTSNSPICAGSTLNLSVTAASGFGYSWSGPNNFTSTSQTPSIVNATTAAQGTYSLTEIRTSDGCPTYPGTVSVVVNTTAPAPSASTNSPVCAGDTIKLHATGLAGYTFTWSGPNSYSATGANPIILNATTANQGTYFVSQSQGGCQSPNTSVSVVVNTAPAPTNVAASPNPVCSGGNVSLSATGSGTNFTWTFPDGGGTTGNPATRNNLTTAMSGNYCVKQTVSGCVSPQACTNLVVNQLPAITNVSGTGPTTCGGTNGSITITGTGIAANTSYNVSYTRNSVAVGPVVIVSNGSAQIIISGLNAGTYAGFVVGANGCSSSTAAGNVVLNDPATPPAPTISSNSPVCQGDTLKLFASGVGTSFTWTSNVGFNSNSQNPVRPNAQPSMTGQYCATQTQNGCTSPQACMQDTVRPLPVIANAVGTSPTTCSGTNGFITISGLTNGQTYTITYSKNNTAQTPVVAVASAGAVVIPNLSAGSYTNIVVTLNGCSSAPFGGTITLTDPATPAAPSLSSNGPVCQGDTLKLFASGSGTSFAWTSNVGFSSALQNPIRLNAQPAMSGQYCATQTQNACTSPQACINVVVNPLPVISSTGSTGPSTCGGTNGTITLSGLANNTSYIVTYLKNASAQGPFTISSNGTGVLTISGLGIGTYSNIVVTLNNCSSAPAGPITLNNPTGPNPPTASTNAPVCVGSQLTVSVNTTTGATYLWSGPQGYSSAQASPVVSNSATTLMTGTYKVIVSLNNCPDSSTVAVVVNPNPTADAGTGGAICSGSGQTFTLGTGNTASGGTGPYNYSWTPTASLVGAGTANPVASPTGTTTYTVVVTDANGCSAQSTASVVVNQSPTASAGAGFTVCNGSTVVIGGSPTASGGTPGYTYAWNNGASPVSNPTVSPVTLTNYTVTVTDSKGCQATASANVVVNSRPVADAGPDKSMPACSVVGVGLGGSPTASGGLGPYQYLWTPSAGLTPSATVANPNVAGIGSSNTYNVLVTDANGCTATDGVLVTVTSSNLSVNISSNGPQTWCANSGGSVVFTANVTGGTPSYTYAWTGSNLSATGTPSVTANPNVAGSYDYNILITDATGCQAGASTTIVVKPSPTVVAFPGPNDTICFGANAILGGSPTASNGTPPYVYNWSNGAGSVANPVVSPFSTTAYQLTVTDNLGCSGTGNVNVVVNPTPHADAGPDVTIPSCSTSGVQIGGSPAGSGGFGALKYLWSPSAPLNFDTAANPRVTALSASTTFTLTVTDANGCSASDQAVVSLGTSNLTVVIVPNTSLFWCENSGGQVTFTAIPTGGVGPYSFQWTGPFLSRDTGTYTTTNPSAAGTYFYSVILTDGSGCQSANSIQVQIFPSVAANAGPVSQTICNGQTAQLGGSPSTAIGGTPPYTYQWTGGALNIANPTVSPSLTTTYRVIVTDSNNCSASANSTVVVNQNPVADAGVDKTLPSCSPTGIVIGGSPAATGGSSPYAYSWSPSIALSSTGVANPTVIGLTVDTLYTLVVTDNNGCSASDQVVVHVTTSTPTVGITASSAAEWCAGTGTSTNLTANVNGTTGSLSYNWSGTNISPTGFATATVNPGIPGSYTYFVTVTDGANCTATASKVIIVDSLPRANAGENQTICSGFSATLGGAPTAAGGNGPYTYAWNNGAAASSNPTVSPLATTTYIVTVTDNKGCTATASTTITVRAKPVADAGVDKVLPGCSPTGIQIGGSPTASGGGGAPYTYAWSPAVGLSSTTIANPTVVGLLTDTTYTVVVTDANSCTASDQVRVTLSNSSPSANITSSGGTEWCSNTNTSVNLTANVVGGNGPFTYSWTGSNLSPTNTQVVTANPSVAGSYTYTVTVTDGYTCTASATKTIIVDSVPTALGGGGQNGFSTCSGTPVIIGGNPTATGGTGPYTYLWSGGAGTSANPSVSPTSNTIYIVTVTDQHGCTATAASSVTVRPLPTANAGVDQNITSCSGDSITIGGSPSAIGGTPPYIYQWSPSAHLNDASLPNPVVQGIPNTFTYTLNVTDFYGCTSFDNVTINLVPSTLQINLGSTRQTCSSAGSCVQLGGLPTVVGGAPPYVYTWANDPTLDNPASSNPVACPTQTTTYFVTITDSKGCSVTGSQTVVVNESPTVNAGPDTAVCYGNSVVIGGSPTATGGLEPYTYSWNPTSLITPNIANPLAVPIALTTYAVTVTDARGCTATDFVIVDVHTNPTVDAGPDKSITSCVGDSVILGGSPAATGGTGPYTYTWTPNRSIYFNNLANPWVKALDSTTSYQLVVTDVYGCTSNDFATVFVVPSTLQAEAGNDQAICSNTTTPVTIGGSPTATGSTGYTFAWSPASGLSDSTVANPTALPTITTKYFVTVTDARGCTAVDSVTITVNTAPTANAGRDTAICAGFGVVLGGNPTANGGTPGYQYNWFPTTGLTSGNTSNPLAVPSGTTTYIVTVTDSKGCRNSASATIIVNANPVANAGPDVTITSCNADSAMLGGSPSASGGTPQYTYAWSPAGGLSCLDCSNPWLKGNATTGGLYSLTVTDANGCSSADVALVTVVQSNLNADAGNGGSYCAGSGGSVTLGGNPTASGGFPIYTYTWAPNTNLSSTSTANPVASPSQAGATWYYVTVSDTKGCFAIDSALVTVNPTPTANAGTDSTICNGASIQLGGSPTAQGGTGPYAYQWSPGTGLLNTNIANPLASPTGTTAYGVTVTDVNHCTASAAITVYVRPNPTVDAGPDVTLVGCSADSVMLGGSPAATGGKAPYNYQWVSASGLSCSNCPNPFASHLGQDATYTLIVTDSVGCVGSDQVTVHVTGSNLVAEAGNNAVYCQGSNTPVTLGGSPTASGGTPAYTYIWSPATGLSDSTVPNPTALPTSTQLYHLVVIDANGCIGQDTVLVTVNQRPIASAGLPDTVCAGSQIDIGGSPTASGGNGVYTYSWSPALYFVSSTTIANPTIAPLANTDYTVIVTDGVGCSASASVSIQVYQNPHADAGLDQTVVACSNACVTLGGSPTGSGGLGPYRYAWAPTTNMNNSGLANPAVCGLQQSTPYTVTVTDAHGCTATDLVNVSVTPSDLTANAGTDKTVCADQTTPVTIGGNPSVSGGHGPFLISWSPANGFYSSNTIPNPLVLPTGTTTYTLQIQDANGCIAVDSMVVTVDPLITITLGETQTICSGGSALLGGSPTATGGSNPLSYAWSPGNGLSSTTDPNPVATPLTQTTYCLTVTDAALCSASACQTVIVNQGVHANAGPDKSITNCPGSGTSIGGSPSASGGSGTYTYLWTPAPGAPVLSSATVSNPNITGATQPGNYLYTLLVTDRITGCTDSDQVLVVVTQSTLAVDAGLNKTICGRLLGCINIGGNPTATGGAGGYIYQWFPGTNIDDPTIANPCVHPLQTTNYYITVTDANGCSAVDSVTVTVDPALVVNAGLPQAICYGQSTQIGGNPTAQGGSGSYSYQWNPGTFLSDVTNANPLVQHITASTSYVVSVTDGHACTASASVSISVRQLPHANAGPDATIFACAGSSAILGGNPTATGTVGPYTYSWYPPLDTALSCLTCPNPTVSNLGFQTNFSVLVTDSFGCQDSDFVLVTVLPNTLTVEAGANVPTLCSNAIGQCVTLGGTPTASEATPSTFHYTWLQGAVDTSQSVSNPKACPNTTTQYLLVVTDNHGCQASDSVTVVVNSPPSVHFEVPGTGIYCLNTPPFTFSNISPAGGTFTSTGPGLTGQQFNPGTAGVGQWCITYAYTNPQTGCHNDTTICVVVNPLPAVSISGSNGSYCKSDPVDTLFGSPEGGSFSGPGVSVDGVFDPGQANVGANTIVYTFTDEGGCTNTAQVIINVTHGPSLTLHLSVANDSACSGQNVTISPTYSFDVTNIIYRDSAGTVIAAGLGPVTVNPTGVYYCVTATAIGASQCTFDTTICIHVYQPPVTRVDTAHTCEMEATTIDLNNNVTDPQGSSLAYTILTQPAHGTLIDNGNGTYVYTPGNFYHGIDSFTYRVCSKICSGTCATGIEYISVCDTIFPVYAVDDETNTCNRVGIDINVVANDSAVFNIPFHVSQVITTNTIGAVTITGTGTVHYVPRVDTCGFTDVFQYVDSTDFGALDTATVYVSISCGAALNGVPDAVSIGQNGDSVSVNPFANDAHTGAIVGSIISNPHHGTAHFSDDTTLVYIPARNYCGTDTVGYIGVTDCGNDTSYVAVNVICRVAPIAVNDTEYICRNDLITFNLIRNDTAQNGLRLIVTNVTNPIPNSLGEFTDLTDSSVTYAANGTTGKVIFKYTVCDNGQVPLCDTGVAVIFIGNCPPPVLDTIYDTTVINIPDTVCLSGYVTSAGAWHLDTYCQPTNGTVILLDSCLVYVPDTNFVGTDTFCIVVCDNYGCDTSAVIITVLDTFIKIPDIPCDIDTVVMNIPTTLDVLANGIIPKAVDTVVTIQTPPVIGQAVVNSNHTITYIPQTNYQGQESFDFVVCAVSGSYRFCDTANICVTVVDTSHDCFIPDGFSPNGDGVNDLYQVPCRDWYPLASLRVFDRWGMEVWNSNGTYHNDWDGKNQQGTVLPDGTYYIIYQYNDGTGKTVAKYVVINR